MIATMRIADGNNSNGLGGHSAVEEDFGMFARILPDKAARFDAVDTAEDRVAERTAAPESVFFGQDFHAGIDAMAEVSSCFDLGSSQIILIEALASQIFDSDNIRIDQMQ